MSYLYSFAENHKTRIAVIERHLQRENYHFGKWKAVLIPKKEGVIDLLLFLTPLVISLS